MYLFFVTTKIIKLYILQFLANSGIQGSNFILDLKNKILILFLILRLLDFHIG